MDKNSVFDIAIIGGGIAGAGIARDAVLRGLKVVLFEKNTFGSGTSSKSSKLIHGGLRYLEIAWRALLKGDLVETCKNFVFVLSALRESAILERIAPNLVKPIELVVPIYKRKDQNIYAVFFGTVLYGWLSFLSGNKRLPRILKNKEAVLKLIPNINSDQLVGGVTIWDHYTEDQKLVLSVMQSAVEHGAEALEHAHVKTYQYLQSDHTYELTIEKNGQNHLYQARKIINASGPWVDKVRESAHERTEDFIAPVAGSHITLKKFTDYSIVLQADDKRIFFVINIGSHARIGTTERIHRDPDRLQVTDEEVEYLFCALERYFPHSKFSYEDILSKDAGIRPLARPKSAKNPHDISREHEIRIGPTGVIHILGVKLTDHRRAARIAVNQVSKKKSRTHLVPVTPSL